MANVARLRYESRAVWQTTVAKPKIIWASKTRCTAPPRPHPCPPILSLSAVCAGRRFRARGLVLDRGWASGAGAIEAAAVIFLRMSAQVMGCYHRSNDYSIDRRCLQRLCQ